MIMGIELNEKELKLIKEALTSTSIRYSYNATVTEDRDVKIKLMETSNEMTELLAKLK